MTDDTPTTARENRKERESRGHRREILDAAVHLFAEHGYHQTTMQMIAERADFSVGYLYKHFPGKVEMYAEMLERHMQRLDAIFAEIRTLGLPPLDELRRGLEMVCDHFNAHRDFMRIYHLDIEDSFAALAGRKERHMTETNDLLVRARESGALAAVDADLLATIFSGAVRELFHHLADRPGETPFRDLTDTVFELIIDPHRA